MTVWIYRHEVKLNSRQCWDHFCAAGGGLLNELLTLRESQSQPEDASLVLIGHRLGAFILKKALIDAHRRNQHSNERALFEALQTLIIIGDPHLHDDNRPEWTRLIAECLLSSKKLSPEMCSEQALTCLKAISDTFEDFTVQSRFFQVSGLSPVKSNLLRLKGRTKCKRCICYANISVRMWSTADDDDTVSEGEGDDKSCVFHDQSKHHKTLVLIASNEFEPQAALPFDMGKLIIPGHSEDTQCFQVGGLTGATNIAISEDADPSTILEGPPSASLIQLSLNGSDIPRTTMTDDGVENKAVSGHKPRRGEKDGQLKQHFIDTLGFQAATLTATDTEFTKDPGAPPKPDVIAIVLDQNMSPCHIQDDGKKTYNPVKNLNPLSNCGDADVHEEEVSKSEQHNDDDYGNEHKDEKRDSDGDDNGENDNDEEGDGHEDNKQPNNSNTNDDDNDSYQLGGTENSSQECAQIATRMEDGRSNQISDKISDKSRLNRSLVFYCQPCMRGRRATTTTARPRRLPLRLRLPNRPSPFFGRQDILQALKSIFFTGKTTSRQHDMVVQRQNIAVLKGAGGIGKTVTALEFVHRYGIHFEHIFWIQASNPSSLAQSFHEVAVALGLIKGRNNHNHAQSKAALGSWFEATESRWLMIFDNADELEYLEPYLPRCNIGSIIVTSRREDPIQLQQANRSLFTVQMPTFTETESSEFLELLLNMSSLPSSICGSQDAVEVGNLLGGHPLGLSLAAAYVNCSTGSFSERLQGWHNLGRRLQGASSTAELCREVQLGRKAPLVLSTMLSLGHMSPAANNLCTVLSFLDPYDIQDSLLLGAQSCESVPLSGFPVTDEHFAAAKDEVLKFRICEAGYRPRSLQMHRAIQMVIQTSMRTQKLVDAFDTASTLLLAQWPSERKFRNIVLGNWPEFDKLHSHVHRLSELFETMLTKIASRKCRINPAFPKLLLQSTWYNSCVRGNAEEDLSLIELAHALLASPCQELAVSTSRVVHPGSPIPRRLVYIDDKTESWRVIDTEGHRVAYFALSYCWGDQSDLLRTAMLTKSTLRYCKSRRRVSEMPRLYRDAFDLTIRLGVRYLWVYALCIIQDDAADYGSEVSNMADIYRNASCTISLSSQCRLPVLSEVVSDHRLIVEPYSILSHGPTWNNRTWVAQETILAPRNLDFLDANQFVWLLGEHDTLTNGRMHQTDCPPNEPELIFHTNLPVEQWKHSVQKEAQSSHDEARTAITSTPRSAMATEAVSVSYFPPEEIDSTDSNSHGERHELRRSLALAINIANQGVEHYGNGQPLEAIAKFVKARDYISALMATSVDAVQGHLLFSTYLALAYLGQQIPDVAVDILVDAEKLLHECTLPASQIPLVTMGRFYFALGDAQLALKHVERARRSYEQAAKHLTQEDGEGADLFAIVQLKISDISVSDGTFKEAHELIRSTIAHFEVQDSPRGQAQYARALHRLAIAFGTEGNERIRKVKFAAAKQALLDFREEQGHTESLPNSGLTKEDFENVLEFGFK